MNFSSIDLDESTEDCVTYKIDLLISDLSESLESEEIITCISSYATNVYVGTSYGRILHYHQFPDFPSYMLISQINASSKPLTRMLILSGIERILVLTGNIVSTYTLPELSPCHIGKLKNINDLSHLGTSSRQNREEISSTTTNEKIIAFSSNKIRILQINRESIKSLKEINYSNAITGISASSNKSPNYSNIGLIANKRNYVIVDFKETKQSTLFDYCPEWHNQEYSFKPNIIPFKAKDRGDSEEYLLTICSDERTSIGMFIDSSGNATRGTLTWLDSGIPIHGIVIEWPYVLGIFEKQGSSKFIVSSLTDLKIKFEHDLSISLEQDNTIVEELSNNKVTDEEEEEGKTTAAIIKQPNFNICRVSNIDIASEQITDLFQLKNIKGENVTVQTNNIFETGSLIIYEDKKIWLLHEEDVLVKCQNLTTEYFGGASNTGVSELLEHSKSFEKGERLKYILQLLILVLYHLEKFEDCLNVALTIEDDELIIQPLFVIYLSARSKLNDSISKEIKLFSGILKHINQVKVSENRGFLKRYLEKIFPIYTANQRDASEFIREITYEVSDSYDGLVSLVNLDREFWKSSREARFSLLNELQQMKKYYSLIYIYQIILDFSEDKEYYAEKICDTCFQIMHKEEIPSESFTEDKIDLIGVVLNQLSSNFKSANVYAKYLLEFLNYDPNKGIEFMKNNNKKEFTATHKSIMDEMSKSYKGELNLNLLRIEYLEYLILEDPSSEKFLEELIIELLKEFESPHIANVTNKNNFEVLLKTYSIDNSLNNESWPKIGWIDYLFINMENSECEEYIKLYLKISELLIYARYKQQEVNLNPHFKEEPIYDFFSVITGKQPQITNFLKNSDYSTAEYFALFGLIPNPSQPFYPFPKNEPDLLSLENIRENLKIIFQFYADSDCERIGRNLCIQHFVESYAINYFSSIEILTMIPDYVPLFYIQKYLMEIMINSNAESRSVIMKKAISKADSSFSKTLIKDLN